MTLDPAPSAPATNGSAPRLCTILLTDLVDSTAWVERLGDGAAADLFRAHDRLTLELLQQWSGRLIDRSDGLLLLFERPIDGLAFALDYNRGLARLGTSHAVVLEARTGLHVGEVLSWRNSDEAISMGAKPVEVEGLAKPMAARLMTMARPGQILLSATAESLTHRAARELGERGKRLSWQSHGRWRFKGVSKSQEVFEVGEAGLAPLRAPCSSAKAWRDVALWRRPAALVAEAAMVLALGVGLWVMAKPQPAIAFNERDWVVLADLRNLTDQPLLDASLEQAFRISLEQSRHVNVLSDLKTQATLARMQRKPGTALDRALASEIAIRDGARAVILPTVAEVGGRVRVSAEVIDPHSQTTVYAEYADGKGALSALESIDQVTAALRGKLGEALEAIEQDSMPLPEASTQSLDALRAYALGNAASGRGQWDEAVDLYQRAVAVDPEFALAHLAISRAYVALSDRSAALPYLDKALASKDRLPQRDRLYLEAWEAELRIPGEVLSRWKVLASMYPDFFSGQANTSWHLFMANEFEQAAKYAQASDSPHWPLRAFSIDQIGRIQLAQGHVDDAVATFERANVLLPGVSDRRRASALALTGQHDAAVTMLQSMPRSGHVSDDSARYIDLVTLAADQARWDVADARAQEALALVAGESDLLTHEFDLIAASVKLIGSPGSLSERDYMKLADGPLANLKQAGNAEHQDDAFMALVAAYLGQRAGYSSVADKVLDALTPWKAELAGTVFDKMLAVVTAENDRLAGKPDAAIRGLEVALDGSELVQAHVAMQAALRDAGRQQEAVQQSQWLAAHRGRAYMEANAAQVLQALNVMDTRLAPLQAAEALSALHQDRAAAEKLDAFVGTWPRTRLPDYLERRVAAISPASKQ